MFQLAARPGSPLDAALHVMADLHEPDEALLAQIESVFDPYRCPDEFVPWLTRWVGLDWLVVGDEDDEPAWSEPADAFPPGLDRLRDVVAIGGTLAQWRGTDAGLRLFLTAATGLHGFSVTEPEDRPFHLVVTAPTDAEPHAAVLRRIVAATKPAATTAELTFTPPATPTTTEGAS
jgi:phage tail-like protein